MVRFFGPPCRTCNKSDSIDKEWVTGFINESGSGSPRLSWSKWHKMSVNARHLRERLIHWLYSNDTARNTTWSGTTTLGPKSTRPQHLSKYKPAWCGSHSSRRFSECMNNCRTSTLSFTLCNSSDNTDESVVLANWCPTDDDFMYERILQRTSQVTDSMDASTSDYKQTTNCQKLCLIHRIIYIACYTTQLKQSKR